MDSDSEPFLPLEYGNQEHQEHEHNSCPSRESRATWKVFYIFHFCLLAFYSIIGIIVTRSYSCTSNRPQPTAAIDHLDFQYTSTIFRNLSGNHYAGSPSSEIDAAWNELLASMHIRISEEELQRDNQESVALTQGGGYLGWMGVFHELHCIKMLREWNYREYYHPNLLLAEAEHLGQHIDHCFELLRQMSMCHADASLTTFKWHPNKTEPMFNATESVHTCVDWSILMKSIANRVVEEDEIGRLKNPWMEN